MKWAENLFCYRQDFPEKGFLFQFFFKFIESLRDFMYGIREVFFVVQCMPDKMFKIDLLCPKSGFNFVGNSGFPGSDFAVMINFIYVVFGRQFWDDFFRKTLKYQEVTIEFL